MSQYLALLLDCPVVIAAIFICGIGGTFQYGYSVSVMTSPSVFIKELVNKTCQQRYGVSLEQWQVSLIWSFTVSIFCIGGLVGALVSGQLLSKYGRKYCLLLNNFVAIFGAVLMILSQRATSFEMIMVGRFLYGINSGVSLSVHTLYLVECAPKRVRGMVGVTISTFISLGKFSGQLLGISEFLGTEERWPWLLGFNGFTALLQLATLPFLPESPSFLLLHRGDREACDKALKRLWGNKDYTMEVEEMMKEKTAMQSVRSHSVMELIRNQTVRWQLITIIITFTGLQLCGINAVYFYSFDVFRAAGIQEGQLRYVALGTGLCEVSTSVACFMIIESTGKKDLLFRGYMAMSATLVLLTITLYLQNQVPWMSYCSMALIFLFIIFFASGPAGIIAPLPGEILTQSFKSAGYTVACTLNWTGLFGLGMLFPVLVENMGYFCFLIFLIFCSGCGLYVRFNVPETKNKTVLEIAAEFERMHSKSGESKKKSTELNLNGIKTYETKF
ncbi:putative solute carrier family 2 facilitated glucose transporter member 5-like [Scophthalmus maximus]|uniref:Solute carrier family 2, facilitated glucose transporter member 5 n=1 Tax=Scophthalmus maximus TaxID=52904 RepID=A0A2U9CGM5_SCOMX|nr:solute carrier family 2 member 11, like [Scophthalmus maximus]AWP15170.1 putative solute carrier family 2 facilitated glucose transporter member 5-like [Scophthalmus maximus]